MADVFISYVEEDSDVATVLSEGLEAAARVGPGGGRGHVDPAP